MTRFAIRGKFKFWTRAGTLMFDKYLERTVPRPLDIKGFMVQWSSTISLSEICMLQLLKSGSVKPDVEQARAYGIILDQLNSNPEIKVEQLPDRVKGKLVNLKKCVYCTTPHFDHGVMFYNLSGAHTSVEEPFCSVQCAEMGSDHFDEVPFYRVKQMPGAVDSLNDD